MGDFARRGFTLVELLVVITIIAVLVALMMPAVQNARESARNTQCSNGIRNLAMGALHHEETHGFFPTGGWGYTWVGLPDQGYDYNQPGGWIYNVLPFIEQEPLHDLGKGNDVNLRKVGSAQRVMTPLSILHCPTRRRPVLYPPGPYPHSKQPMETNPVTGAARNDYAINGGSVKVMHGPGPTALTAAATFSWPSMAACDGLSHARSTVTTQKVTDGLSSTYLIGEKYLNPDLYNTGTDSGDNETAYSGNEEDIIRWGNRTMTPMRDRTGVSDSTRFGSAHPAGLNCAFADGRVQHIVYDIDPLTHENLARRNDAIPIDPSKL